MCLQSNELDASLARADTATGGEFPKNLHPIILIVI
jgi:hypothetical protein